jgi:hypothetical protein
MTRWIPGGSNISFMDTEFIKDYPVKSAYTPHLEALLRLGRISDANDLYDELIRLYGHSDKQSESPSNNAQIAANVARSLGMEDIAGVWEQGHEITKTQHMTSPQINLLPKLLMNEKVYGNGDYFESLRRIVGQLSPPITNFGDIESGENLPWGQDDDTEIWALITGDNRILAFGTALPDLNDLQDILNRNNIKSNQEYCRSYIAEYGTQPGLELYLATEIIRDNTRANPNSAPLNSEQTESIWDEAVSRLNRILANYPDALFDLPYVHAPSTLMYSESMKSLSVRIAENIELLLSKRPSSESLWYQWLSWRTIEGVDRPIEPLLDAIEPCPLAMPGTVPPTYVLNLYLYECQKNEKWLKVIKILKDVWDREFPVLVRTKREEQSNESSRSSQDSKSQTSRDFDSLMYMLNSASLGNNVGIPLMEAYLNDQKPAQADEIFKAWINFGGTFKDISKIVNLAKEMGQERLAREWGGSVKK